MGWFRRNRLTDPSGAPRAAKAAPRLAAQSQISPTSPSYRDCGLGPLELPEPGETLYAGVPKWFPGFTSIEGIDSDLMRGVPRELALPESQRPWIYHGERFKKLQWPSTAFRGPAWERTQVRHTRGTAPQEVLEVLRRDLRLPGVGEDYHFLLQNAVEALWADRDTFDDARETLLLVANADLQLALALPEWTRHRDQFLGLRSLERLAAVLEQLGRIQDAYDVTVIAEQFDQLEKRRNRLKKKLS